MFNTDIIGLFVFYQIRNISSVDMFDFDMCEL